jgi:hypothetical protein
MCHAWAKREKCTRFWWEGHSEDQSVDERMGSKWTSGTLAGGCGLDSAGTG